jgi:hypothetical protein
MKLLLSLILMTGFCAHALETDNYLAWSVNLPDSSGDINQLIQSQIQDSYLSKNDGRWELTKIPDIRNYVNPHWDESFNLSFRAKGMWEVSAREIKEKYCPLKDSEQVQTRFKLYQENAKKSQSVDRLCEIQG